LEEIRKAASSPFNDKAILQASTVCGKSLPKTVLNLAFRKVERVGPTFSGIGGSPLLPRRYIEV